MGGDGEGEPSAATLSGVELDAARFGFHRAFPQRSAKRVIHFTQLAALLALAAALSWAWRADAEMTWRALKLVAFALFATAIAWRLLAAAHLKPPLSRLAAPAHWPTYTILCPLYREGNVVADLVAALMRLDYPHRALDIKLLVEADDADTLAAARTAAGGPVEVLVIPPAAPRTKPKALNAGLARARGEYVVVFDAEDRPHPQQLRAALAAFEDGGDTLACVQAPLSIDNGQANWLARQFAAEYAVQFRQMLPLLAHLNLPLPLGGSSNHFRTDALRAVGGWDPYNVSKDRSKFANGYAHLRRGTLRVPLLSQSFASAW